MSRRAALRLVVAVLAATLAVDMPGGIGLASGPHHHHHRARHHRHHPRHLTRRLARTMPTGVHVRAFFDRSTHSVVHLAVVEPGAPVRFRAVAAGLPVHEPQLRRTSTMCGHVHCLVAVNGSFRDLPSRLPRGGMVIGGRPIKLHAWEPRQAVFSPRRPLRLGGLYTDIQLGFPDGESLGLESVNLDPGQQGVSLFTPSYGRRAPRGLSVRLQLPHGSQVVVGGKESALVVGHASRARRLTGERQPVIVAHGPVAYRLRRLMRDVEPGQRLTLSSTSPVPHLQTIGTSFRILHDRRVNIPHPHWRFVRGHEPRTMLASRANGAVMLITVDGRWRRHSLGATMTQAARLARRLGAVDAVNLDGGGSTTFVMRGHVVNHPSDGRERGVSNALALVMDRSRPFDPNYLRRMRAARRSAS